MPSHTACAPESPIRYSCQTVTADTATLTTMIRAADQRGSAVLEVAAEVPMPKSRRRPIHQTAADTMNRPSAKNRNMCPSDAWCVIFGFSWAASILLRSHSPACVVIGTKTSTIRQVSGLMKPSLRRAAGHTALSAVNSAPSGASTTMTWINSTCVGKP